MSLPNRARGEVAVSLGGREVRLCVTLGALARMEGHFGVSGFEALGERMQALSARDLQAVLEAVAIDDLSGIDIGFSEAVAGVVAAFGAMNG